MTYDNQNIFAKILRGDIPSNKIYEDEYVLAIHDAFPQAPIHVLILPKGSYISMTEFSMQASDTEVIALNRAVGKVVEELKLVEGGYRLIANAGSNGGQEVPHLHWHIIGGEKLGPMLSKKG
jgi:histidine triad (HIT) family protein